MFISMMRINGKSQIHYRLYIQRQNNKMQILSGASGLFLLLRTRDTLNNEMFKEVLICLGDLRLE